MEGTRAIEQHGGIQIIKEHKMKSKMVWSVALSLLFLGCDVDTSKLKKYAVYKVTCEGQEPYMWEGYIKMTDSGWKLEHIDGRERALTPSMRCQADIIEYKEKVIK